MPGIANLALPAHEQGTIIAYAAHPFLPRHTDGAVNPSRPPTSLIHQMLNWLTPQGR